MARDRVGRSLATDQKIGSQHGAPFLEEGGRARGQCPNLGSYMDYDRGGISNAFEPSYVPGCGMEVYRATRPFNSGSVGGNSPFDSDKHYEPFSNPTTFIEYSSDKGAEAFGKDRPRRLRA